MVSDALLGAIIGLVGGFGSAIGTDIMKRWITHPRISVCEESVEVKFHYRASKYGESDAPEEFSGTMIRIQNKGTTAAEDCKATLIVGEQEYRVASLLPKQDFTVIINSHDSEYVDLCALSSSPNRWSERHRVIFTTERGYGDSQENGRHMNILRYLEADLKISSKNAKRSIKKGKIFSPKKVFNVTVGAEVGQK